MNITSNSIGFFRLGKHINEYLSYEHEFSQRQKDYLNDLYVFTDYNISVWTDENNSIISICCEESCTYKGKELINMMVDNFITVFKMQPDTVEKIFVPIGEDGGQNQTVYDFDRIKLQLWTWRKKIVSVILS